MHTHGDRFKDQRKHFIASHSRCIGAGGFRAYSLQW